MNDLALQRLRNEAVEAAARACAVPLRLSKLRARDRMLLGVCAEALLLCDRVRE